VIVLYSSIAFENHSVIFVGCPSSSAPPLCRLILSVRLAFLEPLGDPPLGDPLGVRLWCGIPLIVALLFL
jgi:hypothetical protein